MKTLIIQDRFYNDIRITPSFSPSCLVFTVNDGDEKAQVDLDKEQIETLIAHLTNELKNF